MEMKEKKKKYQENSGILQDVMDEIMSCMKGRTISYKKEIVDGEGNFSQKKLDTLLDKMLSVWEEEIQDGTDVDATEYIKERRELYRTYLYLVMRCSLFHTEKWEERTDFAFVLEQAKKMSGQWCIIEEKSSGRKKKQTVIGSGEEDNFGLQYHSLLLGGTPSYGILADTDLSCGVRGGITDEGAYKRVKCMIAPLKYNPETGRFETDEEALKARKEAAKAQEAAEEAGELPELPQESTEEADAASGENGEDMDDIYGDWEEDADDDYDWESDLIDSLYLQEQAQKQEDEEYIRRTFQNQAEYIASCDRFLKLYCGAKPTLLMDFYEEIEQIVDWYLLSTDCTVLTDVEKTLSIYGSIKEKALWRAKRYAKGVAWNRM